MSQMMIVDCGRKDQIGKRPVVASCGEQEHRHHFNTDDARERRLFGETALAKFGFAVTGDALSQLDELVVAEARGFDAALARRPLPKVRRVADVPIGRVEWLWPGRFALGAVTMVAGDPGLGKSFLTLDMAARVSRGGRWPEEEFALDGERPVGEAWQDYARPQPASVVLFSAEDDLSRTIRPRLEALGADCQKIVTIEPQESSLDADESPVARQFELKRDVEQLLSVVESLGDCRLVIIDPVSAFLGNTSENANAEVRSLLAPMAELASRHNLAVVFVSHLRKAEGAAIYRTMGSMAFVAASRAAWMVQRDPWTNGPDQRRLMLPVKNNLAPEVGGLAFAIERVEPAGPPVVAWIPGSIESPAGGTLAESRRSPPADAERQQVVEWLRQFLAAGPLRAVEVRDAALAHGYSQATLRRAFRELGGEAVKSTGTTHGSWLWQVPGAANGESEAEAAREAG